MKSPKGSAMEGSSVIRKKKKRYLRVGQSSPSIFASNFSFINQAPAATSYFIFMGVQLIASPSLYESWLPYGTENKFKLSYI